jgi:hypothetical protein
LINDRISFNKKPYQLSDAKHIYADAVKYFQSIPKQSRDFWNIMHEADLEMVNLVLNPGMKSSDMNIIVKNVCRIITEAWNRGGSWRKLVSIDHHYSTVALILDKTKLKKNPNQKLTEINNLRAAIQILLDCLNDLFLRYRN